MIKRINELRADVMESAEKLWLAGLGTLVLAQETGTKIYSDAVERGREMEADRTSPFAKVSGSIKNVTDRAMAAVETARKGVDEQMTATLHRMGIPTRDEIMVLTERVEMLTLSVERLKPRAARPAVPVKPESVPTKAEVRAAEVKTEPRKADVKPTETIKPPENTPASMKPIPTSTGKM